MKPLYEIQAEHQAILDEFDALMQAEEPTPEQLNEMNARLEINAHEFEAKAEAYAAVIVQKRSQADFLKAEAKKLLSRAAAEENAADRLQDRIEWAMNAQGLEKVELPHFKLRFHNSKSVKITDLKLLPDAYVKTKTETAPDKQAIKKAIEAGESIPGAELEAKRSLIVK